MKNTKITDDPLKKVTRMLEELSDDVTVPKNVKLKIQKVISTLKEEKEISIKVNEAMSEIDDLADDGNLQAYTRTQIWNIVSALENIG